MWLNHHHPPPAKVRISRYLEWISLCVRDQCVSYMHVPPNSLTLLITLHANTIYIPISQLNITPCTAGDITMAIWHYCLHQPFICMYQGRRSIPIFLTQLALDEHPYEGKTTCLVEVSVLLFEHKVTHSYKYSSLEHFDLPTKAQ